MKRRIRSQRGASLVEFALTFMIIMFTLFLLIEFCLWIYCYNVVSDAAKAGVRYAIVHGSGVNTASQSGPTSGTDSFCSTNDSTILPVVTEVQKWASFSIYSTAAMQVTVCYLDGNNKAPNRVRVTASEPVTPLFGFWGTPAVTAAAQGRIVN